jgi:hypothetical protein
MNYFSPYHILTYFGHRLLTTEEELSKIRKKVMAEFELNGGNIIVIQGKELDKDTCLRLIEELKNPETKKIHQQLFKERSLRNFIENGTITNAFLQHRLEDKDPEFLKFIGESYAHQFNRCFPKLIEEANYRDASNILYALRSFPIAVKEITFSKIEFSLKGLIDNLKRNSMNINNKWANSPDLSSLCLYLNKLPDSFNKSSELLAMVLFLTVLNQKPIYSFRLISKCRKILSAADFLKNPIHISMQILDLKMKLLFRKLLYYLAAFIMITVTYLLLKK